MRIEANVKIMGIFDIVYDYHNLKNKQILLYLDHRRLHLVQPIVEPAPRVHVLQSNVKRFALGSHDWK